MKVLMLNGSPHTKGNTYIALREILPRHFIFQNNQKKIKEFFSILLMQRIMDAANFTSMHRKSMLISSVDVTEYKSKS